MNISKALISTNIILKMIAAASSFLTCKSMRSLFTSFPCIPTTEKVREEVGAYSKGGGRFFDIMKEGAGTYSGKGTY